MNYFWNSSHFDILLYLKGFVIWHCVLYIKILFCFPLSVPFLGGFVTALLFYFFFLLVVFWSCVWLSDGNRIIELDHSNSVNGTRRFCEWTDPFLTDSKRAGHVLAPPSRAKGHSSLLLLFCDMFNYLVFCFFSLQGVLVLMCKVINWYFMPITELVCSRDWWQMAYIMPLWDSQHPILVAFHWKCSGKPQTHSAKCSLKY